MRASQRAIIEAVYAAWAAHDVAAVSACLHPDVVYKLHLPTGAWPIAGTLRGKHNVIGSLTRFLRGFDVIEYKPLKISCDDALAVSVAKIQYLHKPTGHLVDAISRNLVHVRGDKILYFEVIHDAERLRAFFEMVSRMSVEA